MSVPTEADYDISFIRPKKTKVRVKLNSKENLPHNHIPRYYPCKVEVVRKLSWSDLIPIHETQEVTPVHDVVIKADSDIPELLLDTVLTPLSVPKPPLLREVSLSITCIMSE